MEYYGDELDGKLPCEFDEAVTGIKRRARGESAVRGGGGGGGSGGGGGGGTKSGASKSKQPQV